MPESASPKIDCPSCGKSYRWRSELAGRKVRCTCGHVMTMPAELGPESPPPPPVDEYALAEDGGYELDIDEPARPAYATSTGKCPSCNQPISPSAVLCVRCGFNLKKGQAMSTAINAPANPEALPDSPAGPSLLGTMMDSSAKRVAAREAAADDAERESRFTEFQLPLILFLLGLALHAGHAFGLLDVTEMLDAGFSSAFTARLTVFVISMVVVAFQLPFLLIAIFLTAKIFGTAYGRLIPGLIKLAALAYFSTAIASIVESLLIMAVGGSLWLDNLAGLVAFFAIAMWMFEMDMLEAVVLWLLGIFFPSLLFGFFIHRVHS